MEGEKAPGWTKPSTPLPGLCTCRGDRAGPYLHLLTVLCSCFPNRKGPLGGHRITWALLCCTLCPRWAVTCNGIILFSNEAPVAALVTRSRLLPKDHCSSSKGNEGKSLSHSPSALLLCLPPWQSRPLVQGLTYHTLLDRGAVC